MCPPKVGQPPRGKNTPADGLVHTQWPSAEQKGGLSHRIAAESCISNRPGLYPASVVQEYRGNQAWGWHLQCHLETLSALFFFFLLLAAGVPDKNDSFALLIGVPAAYVFN